MKLIIGGAYQGKLDFARRTYGLQDGDIFFCTDTKIDFSRRCIADIQEFTYACVGQNVDAREYFEAHRQQWQNSIFICQDIFSGVVPLGTDMRAWRKNTGLLCQYLSANAEGVSRIFCGLEQVLK